MSLLLVLLLASVQSVDPCAPEGRAALADRLATALRAEKALGAEDVRYEPEAFRLDVVRGGEAVCAVNLHNFAREYCAAPEAARADVAAHFAAAAAAACGTRRPSVPARYADAKAALLPVVRSRSFVDAARGLAPDAEPFAGEALGPDLFVALAWDTPENVLYVTTDRLREWGVGWRTAYAAALANLRARSREPLVALGKGVWAGPWNDAYGASRLLLTDELRAVAKGRDVVVAIPSRDALFVCAADDAAALAGLAALTEKEFGEPRPVSALPFLMSKAGAVAVFEPPPRHPAHVAMKRLRVLEWQRTYGEDKQRRDAENERAGLDVFVASFLVAERDGALTSAGVLTIGVHTLLPRTDVVLFVDPETRRAPLSSATFDEALRALGPRAVPLPGYPPRWEVRSLPPAAELEKLGRLPGF